MTEINGDGDLEMTNGNIFLTNVFFQVVLEAGDILVVNTNWWFHETKVFFFRYAGRYNAYMLKSTCMNKNV